MIAVCIVLVKGIRLGKREVFCFILHENRRVLTQLFNSLHFVFSQFLKLSFWKYNTVKISKAFPLLTFYRY